MAEKFCPQHGPYEASYSACPYCAGGGKRPPAPRPLADDDMPTDLGAARGARAVDGEAATNLGGRHGASYSDDDAPTDLGAARKGRRGILDFEDEEETNLGRLHGDDVTELEAKPIGLQGLLWVKEGKRPGHTYKIKDGTEIGRKDADLILNDPKVSSKHARLRVVNDQFRITDFDSSNGTYVNNQRIDVPTLLNENDTIKIGETLFVLKVLH